MGRKSPVRLWDVFVGLRRHRGGGGNGSESKGKGKKVDRAGWKPSIEDAGRGGGERERGGEKCDVSVRQFVGRWEYLPRTGVAF